MNIVLLACLLQTGVFEDREGGLAVDVAVGWDLVFQGADGRIVMRRPDEPSLFVRLEANADPNEEIAAGNWDAYLESYKSVMSERMRSFAMQRHEATSKGDVHALEAWYGAGEGDEAVIGFLRAVATKERFLILSAAVAKPRWEARREAIESTLRSAVQGKAAKDAGARWTDRKNEYSIDVPAGYRVRPERRGNVTVSIFAPEGAANLNVVVRAADKEIEKTTPEDIRSQFTKVFQRMAPDYAMTELEKTTWQGQTAVKFAGEFTQSGVKLSNLQFGVWTDKRSFFLTWTSQREAFKKERERFEASLRSFRVDERE